MSTTTNRESTLERLAKRVGVNTGRMSDYIEGRRTPAPWVSRLITEYNGTKRVPRVDSGSQR